jgi:hypothetical protein
MDAAQITSHQLEVPMVKDAQITVRCLNMDAVWIKLLRQKDIILKVALKDVFKVDMDVAQMVKQRLEVPMEKVVLLIAQDIGMDAVLIM